MYTVSNRLSGGSIKSLSPKINVNQSWLIRVTIPLLLNCDVVLVVMPVLLMLLCDDFSIHYFAANLSIAVTEIVYIYKVTDQPLV